MLHLLRRAGLALALLTGPVSIARAVCDVIPQPETSFRGATASVNRVFASEGELLVLTRDATGCDAGAPAFATPDAEDNVATFVFTPPQGPATAIVRASAAWCAGSFPARQAACVAQLGPGGVASCVPYAIPPAGSVASLTLPLATEGRAGPVKIAVSDAGSPLPCQIASHRCADQSGLAACIDELYGADGSCSTDVSSRHPQFPGLTALPEPNDFAGICDSPDPSIPCGNSGVDVRFTTDAEGNALVPINWAGVLIPGTLPIPRLVRASSSLPAFSGAPPEPTQTPGAPIRVPGLAFLQSYSPKGLRVDPLFNPLFSGASADTELFGSADAERGVIRILRRSPAFRQCAAGTSAGLPCVADVECPGSQCGPARCRGGSKHAAQCSSDAGCPGGECGASLFSFSDRYSAGGTGPITLTNAQYDAAAENPAAIDGLAATEDVFMLIRSEPLEQKDLDGDGFLVSDSVVTLRDAATGEPEALGPGGAPGRRTFRVRDFLFDLPAVAVEDDVVAMLEPEVLPPPVYGTATTLKVFRLEAGGPVELTAGAVHPSEPLGRIGRRSLDVSDGLVFFRESELDGSQQLLGLTYATASPGVSPLFFHRYRPTALTPSGRFATFLSSDAFLPEDGNDASDVFLVDRDPDGNGALDEQPDLPVTRVSIDSDGSEGSCSGPALVCERSWVGPSMTPDGRFVAFSSPLDTLVPGDTNGVWDVFVHDRDADQDGVFDEPGAIATVRTSVASDGSQAAGGGGGGLGIQISDGALISANGRWVVFFSDAANLDPADVSPTFDFFVHDRDADEDGVFDEDPGAQPGAVATYLLMKSLGSAPSAGTQAPPIAMTPDGRQVLFHSFNDLVPADTNGLVDVYVFDRDADRDGAFDEPGATELVLVSVTTKGAAADGNSYAEGLSDDGRFALMYTNAPVMAPGRLAQTLVIRDRDADEDGIFDEPGAVLTRVAKHAAGSIPVVDDYERGALSPDGRFVASCSGVMGCDVFDVETRVGTGQYAGVASVPEYIDVPVSLSARARSLMYADPQVFFIGPDPLDPARDLDLDGDAEDVLLSVVDGRAAAPAAATLIGPAERVAIAAGSAVFLRSEATTGAGVNLNADADADDRVVHLWRNRQGGPAVNLGLAAERVALSEQVVAALVSEAGEGVLLNGDSDLDDLVVHVDDVATASGASWTPLFIAADELQAAGSRIAFTVPEAAQGTPLNGDGDLGDRVLRIYDTASQQFLALKQPDGTPIPGLAVDDFVLGEQVVAFRVNEFGQGQNLNGVAPQIPGGVADADLFDSVLHVADLATGTVHGSMQAAIPCPAEACDPRIPYRVLGSKVTFLTLEADQGGNDLDQSGDTGTGLVLQHFNPVALAGGGSLEDASDVFGGALAGICTATAESCASDLDCGGAGTCYFPPGGCLFDTADVCDADTQTLPVLPGCPAGQFCAPTLGLPGEGTCQEFQGPCLTDAECTAPATCANDGADTERLFAAISEQPDGRQRYVSLGRCSDGDGSCSNDEDCNGGATCDSEVTVIATAADPDVDGLADPIDNCPDVANGDQRDSDVDGAGDACDRQTCGNAVQEYTEGCDHGGQNGVDGVCDAACAYVGPDAACSDGIDNDGDGKLDFAGGDPGCTDANDASERGSTKACDDGRDNDGDYRADFAVGSVLDDAGCPTVNAAREDPQCSDGIDNDNDGKVDWNGGGLGAHDPQCAGPAGPKEGSGCGLGFELVLLAPLLARRRRAYRAAARLASSRP